MRYLLIVSFILFFQNLYSVELKYPKFPFKGYIFSTLGIPYTNIQNVSISEEKQNFIKFEYAGITYDAQLFNYGGIYIKKSNGTSSLIPIDLQKTKYPTFIKDSRMKTYR